MNSAAGNTNLLWRLKNGDQRAFTLFHEEYSVALCYFVQKIILDLPAAEDITTESFVKTFQRITDFADIPKMKGFLYTIAYRKALDFLRMKKQHDRVHEAIKSTSSVISDDVERQFIKTEALRLIYLAIQKLPPQAQEVIRKNVVDGKPLDEVAEEMQIAYKTVQHYKTTGLKTLRLALLKDDLLPVSVVATALNVIEVYLRSK